jgi:transposase-like protein
MAALSCPKCSSTNVININLTTDEGAPLEFYSCHACETRWWYKDGVPVELGDVLELAKREPRRRARS